MNKDEWIRFFKVHDEQEALDAYDDALFEIKTHFLHKPWLRLTAQPRMKQLNALTALEEPVQGFKELNMKVPTDSMLAWWNAWQAERNELRKKLNNAQKAGEMLWIIEQGLALDNQFCSVVPKFEWTSELPVFGTEPDVMTIHKELVALEQMEIRTFVSLFEVKQRCSVTLLLALQRWSMLSKYL